MECRRLMRFSEVKGYLPELRPAWLVPAVVGQVRPPAGSRPDGTLPPTTYEASPPSPCSAATDAGDCLWCPVAAVRVSPPPATGYWAEPASAWTHLWKYAHREFQMKYADILHKHISDDDVPHLSSTCPCSSIRCPSLMMEWRICCLLNISAWNSYNKQTQLCLFILVFYKYLDKIWND